jgi:iron complex outermembrane recepter protein
MLFQRRKVASALALLMGAGGTAAILAPAQAQDIRVDVTGTNIRRVEAEGALPVQVITRADIEREGIQTAISLVERLSSNSSVGGLNLSGSEGGTLVGYQSASLRGLGGPRTLVLLNGRRLTNTAFSGTTVDINSIPLSAIERVEVLTDGASAIYGTDAIAGVINFITRQDFTGVEFNAFYGDSQNGGGEQQRYNISGGWGNLSTDRFNIWGSLDYYKVEEIRASDRPYSATAYLPNAPGGVFDRTSGNSIPGNVFLPAVPGRAGQTRSPANPACLPPFSFPTAGSPNQCRFDYASVIDIVPPSEAWNAFAGGRWQFHKDHQAFFEAAWNKNESIARVSPPPVSSATILSGDPVLTIPGTPFYPAAFAAQYGLANQPLEVFWRGLELGPRTDKNTVEQVRFLGGLQGVIAGWDYSTAINYSKAESTTEWLAGWSYGSVLLPILNSGRINLFGLNNEAALTELRTALILGEVLKGEASMTEFDAKASKEIFKLPAGPLAVAFGTTYRQEEYELISSEATVNADVPGLGGSISTIPKVDRNVWAVYAEANIPIVQTLEANVALRYDDYENVGSTTNPKISLRWQPTRQVLVRGAWGTGFRAPSLFDLYQPNLYGATGDTYDDPLRCPSTGSPRDCNAQFTTQLGGNPTLRPEESTNWTAGVVWEPVNWLSIGLEYWNVKIDNVIGIPAETPIFSDMVAAEAAGLLVRYAPGSAGCQGAGAPPLPCPVNFGIQNLVNLTTLKTSGVDLTFSVRPPATAIGQFTFAFNGTKYLEWKQQSVGEAEVDLIGRYGGGVAATVVGSGSTGAFPKWKHNANLGWSRGPWSANLHQNYVHGYEDADATRRVGTWSVYDVNASYTGFKNLTLTLGIKNLFDRDPPYTRQGQAFQVGYDPSIADPTGRFFWGAVKYAFR